MWLLVIEMFPKVAKLAKGEFLANKTFIGFYGLLNEGVYEVSEWYIRAFVSLLLSQPGEPLEKFEELFKYSVSACLKAALIAKSTFTCPVYLGIL